MLNSVIQFPKINPAPILGNWAEPNVEVLDSDRYVKIPSFPTHIFPEKIKNWIEQQAEHNCTTEDILGTSLLAVVGVLLSNVRHPQIHSGWSEAAQLWIANIAPPGSNKSSGMKIARALLDREEARLKVLSQVIKNNRYAEQAVAAQELKAWKKEVDTAIKEGSRRPEFPESAIIPPDAVSLTRSVTDITREMLLELSRELKKGILSFHDEIGTLLSSFGRYTGGDPAGYRSLFLSAFDGGKYSVALKGSKTQNLDVEHLSIGLLGGIQPGKLDIVLGGDEDGFAERFLFSWSKSRDLILTGPKVDIESIQRIIDRISRLSMNPNGVDPIFVPLVPECLPVLENFDREINSAVLYDVGRVRSYAQKARGKVVRIANILAHLEWACGSDTKGVSCISVKHLDAAILIFSEYYLSIFMQSIAYLAKTADGHASDLAGYLDNKAIAEFNLRDLRRAKGRPSWLADAGNAAKAAKALADAGWLREPPRGRGAGRPAGDYEVHPDLQAALAGLRAGL